MYIHVHGCHFNFLALITGSLLQSDMPSHDMQQLPEKKTTVYLSIGFLFEELRYSRSV